MTNITRSRGWVLTQSKEKMNLEDLTATLADSGYPYVFQEEKGKEDGFEHFQIYLETQNPIKFDTLKKRFPNAHIEARRGSKQQAHDYCTKEDTRISGPYFGNGAIDLSQNSGKRTDLATLRELVLSGVPVSDIILTEPSAHLHLKYLDRLAYEYSKQRFSTAFRDLEVEYIWGPTGSGKTSHIYNTFPIEDIYRPVDWTHPFDEITDHDVLVLDEFHSQLPASLMLSVLDRYPFQLPARYNNRWAGYTKVFIISNIPFEEQYPNLQDEKPEVFAALKRRINKFSYKPSIGEGFIYEDKGE